MAGLSTNDNPCEPGITTTQGPRGTEGESPEPGIAIQSRTNNEASLENVNYARVCCLLMQEGTKRMQNTVLQRLPERHTLAQILEIKQDKLKNLVKGKSIMQIQYETIYPFTGDLSKIDIPLWMVLARHVTVKNSRKGVDWRKSPEPHETNWTHDMIRLREIRNFLFHVSLPELSGERFNEIKSDLIRTLRRLGSSDGVINGYMTRNLDPQQTRICELQIREQYMEEQNSHLMKSVERKKHTRIFTAVLAILAALVVVGVSVPVAWYLQQKKPCTPNLIQLVSDSGLLDYMPRHGWGAVSPKRIDPPLKRPLKMAAIFHTALVKDKCLVNDNCCEIIKSMQTSAMKGKWNDIPYNFLIGDDGVIYEGRGPLVTGGAAWRRDHEILSIGLIGNYACIRPSGITLVALYVLLEYMSVKNPTTGRDDPILDPDYALYGHCQINLQTPEHNVTFFDAPGAATMHELMYWNHWRSENITQCDIYKDCIMSSLCREDHCNTTTPI